MKFKIGDEVYLREGSRWNNGNISNPLGVVGTIDEDNYDDYGVMWSNGEHNSAYTDYDLVLASEIMDNTTPTELDPLVEIRQSEYTALIEEINLLQELLAEANARNQSIPEPTVFKPVSEYTMEDWEQALNKEWKFECRGGHVVTIQEIDKHAGNRPILCSHGWYHGLDGLWDASTGVDTDDIIKRIK